MPTITPAPSPVFRPRRREVRRVFVPVEALGEYLAKVVGSPMPGWTGIITEEPEEDPPTDPSMRAVSFCLPRWRRLDKGRVEVEVTYLEVVE